MIHTLEFVVKNFKAEGFNAKILKMKCITHSSDIFSEKTQKISNHCADDLCCISRRKFNMEQKKDQMQKLDYTEIAKEVLEIKYYKPCLKL